MIGTAVLALGLASPQAACADLVDQVASRASVPEAALAAGVECVALVLPFLSATDDARHSAAHALVLFAHPRALDALYEAAALQNDPQLKIMAAFGAAALGRPADVDFLCSAFQEGGALHDSWRTSQAAAYSLGILKNAPCRSALAELALVDSRIEGAAAQYALRAISERAPCRAQSGAGERHPAVEAVLACTIPYVEEDETFYERSSGRLLHRTALGWTSEPAPPQAPTLPSLDFKRLGGDTKGRALVSVSLVCGSLCGFGYDFLVVESAGEWVVRAVRFVWIS